jgi:hypothetical protein
MSLSPGLSAILDRLTDPVDILLGKAQALADDLRTQVLSDPETEHLWSDADDLCVVITDLIRELRDRPRSVITPGDSRSDQRAPGTNTQGGRHDPP